MHIEIHVSIICIATTFIVDLLSWVLPPMWFYWLGFYFVNKYLIFVRVYLFNVLHVFIHGYYVLENWLTTR